MKNKTKRIQVEIEISDIDSNQFESHVGIFFVLNLACNPSSWLGRAKSTI